MTKVLWIEDDVLQLQTFTEMLRYEDYDTLAADNGIVGLEYARQHQPDLIICDIMMPGLDGYGVLREVRKDSNLASIPFIFVTARNDETDIEQGLKMGVDDYITKPFDASDLLFRVKKVLTQRALRSFNHEVFLSYSRRDEEPMRRVKVSLRDANLRVWVDEEGLEPGTRSWRRAVQEAIDRAGCVVVILSPHAKQSEWVEAELDYAESQKKTIFPVIISGNKSNAIPFGYTLAQWINVVEKDYTTEMQKLITAIHKRLNST